MSEGGEVCVCWCTGKERGWGSLYEYVGVVKCGMSEAGCVGVWVWLSLCRSSYRDCVETGLESVGMSCSIPIPYSMCRRGT